MKLSDAAVLEFKELYRASFSIELSDAEAADAAQQLIRLVTAIQPNKT